MVGHLEEGLDARAAFASPGRHDPSATRPPGKCWQLTAPRSTIHTFVDLGSRASGGARGTLPGSGHSTRKTRPRRARSGLPSRGGCPCRSEKRHLEGRVRRPRTGHARFEEAADRVALQQQREASRVILVRVGEDHEIDPPVPRRGFARPAPRGGDRGRAHHQPAGVRPPVSGRENVALADVERDQVDATVRAGRRGNSCPADREREDDGDGPHGSIEARRVKRPRWGARPTGRRDAGAWSGAAGPRDPGLRARVRQRTERARREQVGDAPSRADGEEQGRGNPAERRPGRGRKRQPRERQVRGRLDDRCQQPDHERTGQADSIATTAGHRRRPGGRRPGRASPSPSPPARAEQPRGSGAGTGEQAGRR